MNFATVKKTTPGVVYSLLIGVSAFLLRYIPLLGEVGSTTMALLLGVAAAHLLPFLNASVKQGVTFSEKKILPFAIALMGFSINFFHIAQAGARGAAVVGVTISVSIATALFLGKLFRFRGAIPFLIGMGNGVCGTSAVVVAARVIGADDEEEGVVIPVINFLGVVGIALIPFLVNALQFSGEAGGMLAGGTLQAVGQATAAAFAIGEEAGTQGVIIKMFRVTLLGPLLVLVSLALQFGQKRERSGKINLLKLIPLFLLVFLAASLVNTFIPLLTAMRDGIAFLSRWALLTAMAAIGLKIHVKTLIGQGAKVLLLGVSVWAAQIAVVIVLLRNLF